MIIELLYLKMLLKIKLIINKIYFYFGLFNFPSFSKLTFCLVFKDHFAVLFSRHITFITNILNIVNIFFDIFSFTSVCTLFYTTFSCCSFNIINNFNVVNTLFYFFIFLNLTLLFLKLLI